MRLSTAFVIYYLMQDTSKRRRGLWLSIASSPKPRTASQTVLPARSRATAEELTSLFDIIDVKGDGFITLEKFTLLKRSMNCKTSMSAAAEFNRADYDGDGKISLDEWLRFGKDNPPTSAAIQDFIQRVQTLQYGFSDTALATMNRKKLFRFSKRNHLGIDACATNEELRNSLQKLFNSKHHKQSWTEWFQSFWE